MLSRFRDLLAQPSSVPDPTQVKQQFRANVLRKTHEARTVAAVGDGIEKFSLRQLRYFVTVAEAGTMAAAAERHHISQSAISLAVTQLERGLGVQLLLRRKSRGIALTDAGRRLLPEARTLLAHAGEVQSTAQSISQNVSGELTVGCFPTITPFVLPDILRRFPQLHPEVVLQLAEGSVSELTDRLLEGTCEVALLYDLGVSADITKTLLYRVRPYVLLAEDHPLADDRPIRLAELRGEPMVMLDMRPSADMFRAVLASGGVEPDVRFVSASFESVRSLVASGVGYSLLLQRPAATFTYSGPGLVYREIADDVLEVDVILAHARDARPTRRARAFSDYCIATYTTKGDRVS